MSRKKDGEGEREGERENEGTKRKKTERGERRINYWRGDMAGQEAETSGERNTTKGWKRGTSVLEAEVRKTRVQWRRKTFSQDTCHRISATAAIPSL